MPERVNYITIINFQSYLKYAYLWAEDREAQIREFVDSEPITQEIKEKMLEYEGMASEIKHLPERHIIGPIEINMGW